ncbi:unnamed protein product [Trifolium pratense]|uniref:Uncharacterized protein n=1 Tax=Trifolium pratense TaxID=57577 RepID=A0ACB0KBP5_TRIPR|nr:unnamed protein product [Trifolium pratense]
MACGSMLSMCLELSAGVLNHDLQVPKPECSDKLQNFPTRKQNYAENIYTEGNHAARQIYHAARGCSSINYAARGNRITRRVIKSESNLLLHQGFTPRVVKATPRVVKSESNPVPEQNFTPRVVRYHAARDQSENLGSL